MSTEPIIIKTRSKFEYLQPDFHAQISERDRRFITQNMYFDVWRNLKFGGTGRHKSEEHSVFHQHMAADYYVFAFLYERISNTHAQAITFDFGRKHNDTKYFWHYAKARYGGPPRAPQNLFARKLKRSDLYEIVTKPGASTTKKNKKKQKKG